MLGTAGAYLSFEGTQSTAQSGLQLTLPGGINNIGAAEQLALNGAAYDVWLKATESIRTPPLTEAGGTYVNATYINGTYVNGTGTYVGGSYVNVDALDEWCFPCLDGIIWTSKDVNETTGIGTGVGSFGYHCGGLSYQNNTWTFNLPVDTERNTDNCAGWYAYIDGDLASLAGIKNDYNDDTSVAKGIAIKLPAVDKGVADFFSGLRASASGALTIKSTGDTLSRIMNSFSMHPDEILPGKRNLWMNGGVLFASLIESLV